MTLPPPLTPAGCNLRDFGFMPFEITRFRQSDLVAHEDPEAILAAVLLWGEAWHSVPAASLPDDDRALARAAGYGRAVDAFLAVKAGALRGFVKCSDGRLYHPVVAEKARDAWEGKLKQRHRTYCATIRKHNERDRESGGGDQRSAPTFENWLAQGQPTNVTRDTPRSPEQRDLDLPEASRAPPHGREQEPGHAQDNNTNGNVTRDGEDMSRGQEGNVTRETPSKGEGEGEGEGEGKGDSDSSPKAPAPKSVEEVKPKTFDLERLADECCARGGVSNLQPSRIAANLDVARKWRDAGIDFERIVFPTIDKVLTDTTVERIGSLAFFDAAIRKAHALGVRNRTTGAGSGGAARLRNAVDATDKRIATLRDRLKDQVGSRVYADWFAHPHCALSFNGTGNRLVITAPSDFAASWLRKPELVEKIETALGTVTGASDFVVEVEPSA